MSSSAREPHQSVSSNTEPTVQPAESPPRTGGVVGRVCTSSHQPVADCAIDTTLTSRPRVAVAEIGMISGADGTFGRDLLPATYVFTAYRTTRTGRQLSGQSPATTIKSGQTVTVTIVLQEDPVPRPG
jgi:hypothetical protein